LSVLRQMGPPTVFLHIGKRGKRSKIIIAEGSLTKNPLERKSEEGIGRG